MKNALIYYYNLNPQDIRYSNDMYRFTCNNEYYALIYIKEISNIENLYNLSINLNNNGIYTHQFVLNINNILYTLINNKNYVLIKSLEEYNQKICLNDIINFSNITSNIINKNLQRNNWYNLWCEKMDYFEYQINEFEKKYPIINESFRYFDGIVETGIQLLINNNYKNYGLSVCHERIDKNTTLFDLYNPLNFIIDIKVRDIAEYFKKDFLFNNSYEDIINYLTYNNLTEDEIKLFFIRMLYPSFYFDTYEKILSDNIEENKLYEIIDKVEEYEVLIKKIYIYIKKIYIFPEIEWFNSI